MYKLLDEEALDIYEYKQIKEILASKMFYKQARCVHFH